MSELEPLRPIEPELSSPLAEDAAGGGASASMRAGVSAEVLVGTRADAADASGARQATAPLVVAAPVTAVATATAARAPRTNTASAPAPVGRVGWLKLALSLSIGASLGAGVQATVSEPIPFSPHLGAKEARVEAPLLVREPAQAEIPTQDVQTAPPAEGKSAPSRGARQPASEVLRPEAERFPHTQPVEEQEALEVQRLVERGQMVAARKGALRFVRRHPDSPLRAAVERAIEGAP